MTIQEAIKSWKKFRRKTWNDGIWIERQEICSNLCTQFYTNARGYIEPSTKEWLVEDILATDWETIK